MKVYLTDIEWDTEGADENDAGLPSEISLDTVAEGISDDDDLSNWLSNKYGWTVLGYSCDPSLEPAVGGTSPSP